MNEVGKSNIKTGTGIYYRSYKNKQGKTIPAKLSPRFQIAKYIDELLEDKEEVTICVDMEAKTICIQKISPSR
jgi:hypothetical protein